MLSPDRKSRKKVSESHQNLHYLFRKLIKSMLHLLKASAQDGNVWGRAATPCERDCM